MNENTSDPRVQVALTFDYDVVSPWISDGPVSPALMARGEFGVVGVERIRAILVQFEVRGTFYIPGHTALSFPDSVRAIAADGHEIAHHGWVHEGLGLLSEEEERYVIERGIESLESVVGVRPAGFRAPEWNLSSRTIDLLVDYGFSYDSSLMGNDFSPYWCRSGDFVSSDEPFVPGQPVDLVEVPVGWHLDDFPFFEFVPGVTNLTGLRRNEDLLDVWKAEFTYLYEHLGEGCLTVTMHPQSTGRGHRILILTEFIEFVLSHSDAGFVRADQIADRFRASSPFSG